MTFNDQDARALTYLVGRIRKDTHGANVWDEPGTYAVIARMIGQNLVTTIERVVAHAADPDAKTPGAINRPFTPERKPDRARPPKRGEDCDRHPGQWATSCGGCAADRLAADLTPPTRTRPADETTRTTALDQIRKTIANAKGDPL